MKTISLVLASVVMAGCSMHKSGTSTNSISVVPADKPNYVREYEVIYSDTQVSGAALRKEGYIHVLNAREHVADRDEELYSNFNNAVENSNQHYAFYDQDPWSSYCDSGTGLSINDWKLIDKHGVGIMPEHIASSCTPPDYSFSQLKKELADYCLSGSTKISSSKYPALNKVRILSNDKVCAEYQRIKAVLELGHDQLLKTL